MDKRGWMMLRVFINRYNPKAGDALLKFLPQEEMRTVLSQDIRSTDLTPILEQPQKILQQMHYSWIKPLLSHFPEPLRPLVIAALTTEQVSGLSSQTAIPLSPPVKTFLINQLYALLKADIRTPLEYLPETDCSPLAKLSKQQLILLSDFLGLYDLASEVRRIVNRNYLKNIYGCLNPKQFYYLKVCLQQKERLVAPKLDIDPSKRDCEKLKKVVHRRGLLRLGRALCGQHPDFIWYIAHTLDTGRGAIVLKQYQPQAIPNVTPILKSQMLNLLNFLKSELASE